MRSIVVTEGAPSAHTLSLWAAALGTSPLRRGG